MEGSCDDTTSSGELGSKIGPHLDKADHPVAEIEVVSSSEAEGCNCGKGLPEHLNQCGIWSGLVERLSIQDEMRLHAGVKAGPRSSP